MFNHLLLPLDGSSVAECVLPHAVGMATAFEARITLLRVLDSPASHLRPIDPLDWQLYKREAETYLERWEGRLRALGLAVEHVVMEGSAAETVVEYAQNRGVDLIVVSSHGAGGLSRLSISGVVQKILQLARRSTMIVRAYGAFINDDNVSDLRYRRVLIPIDGSSRAECALPAGLRLAERLKADLIVAHAVSMPQMPRQALPTQEDLDLVNRFTERSRQRATQYLEQLRERLPENAQTRMLITEDVADSLHDLVEAEEIDLLVMSAHGHSCKRRWPYGSIATSFIHYGNTPLIVVQDLSPDEFERSRAEEVAQARKGQPLQSGRGRLKRKGTLAYDR